VTSPLLIYGANGYTGRLIAQAAVQRGLSPILAGRSTGPLRDLGESMGLPHRVASLKDPHGLDDLLRGVQVVLHCAGPFSETSKPMLEACLRRRVHYLDITGEIPVFEAARRQSAEARRAGVMLMSGVGFDVVPSDCLALHVSNRLPGATTLAIGVNGLDFATRGSAKTLAEHAGRTVVVRRDGALVRIPPGSRTKEFDFSTGPVPCLGVSWGDVAAAWYTTGIPNIDVYFARTATLVGMALADRYLGNLLRTAPAQAWLKAHADLLPDGPSEEQRKAAEMTLVAEARDPAGNVVRSRLHTPEAYSFTATTAAAIASRVLGGDIEVGFQTPARVYGADWPLAFPGVDREDLV
jgi:short subunit dehydrogenase-like uncharacterized protein